MAHIKNVVQSTQHGDKMYTFVLDAPKLLALCQIERFGEGTDGVERKLDENHALEIAAAMLDADVVWREPICGDLRGNWVFENGQLSYKDGAYISVDDAQHRCRPFGHIQQEGGFCRRRRSLHQNGAIDTMAFQQWCQIGRHEVTVKQHQIWRQPAIVAPVDAPEVLMRVDPHVPITPFFRMILP